jgi:hypothetical protein
MVADRRMGGHNRTSAHIRAVEDGEHCRGYRNRKLAFALHG